MAISLSNNKHTANRVRARLRRVDATDDGRLQARIADPKFKLPKTYLVQVEGDPDDAAAASNPKMTISWLIAPERFDIKSASAFSAFVILFSLHACASSALRIPRKFSPVPRKPSARILVFPARIFGTDMGDCLFLWPLACKKCLQRPWITLDQMNCNFFRKKKPTYCTTEASSRKKVNAMTRDLHGFAHNLHMS